MKWFLIGGISLLIILACVVYLRRDHRALPVPLAPVTVPLQKTQPAPLARKAKVLSGPVDISGPLKDRGLVHWVLPEYPEWAQQQGIGGVYRTKIRVSPAGTVLSFMEPEQLSGEPRLDELAVDALRQWRFVEKPNAFGEQWGIITIRFSLLTPTESSPSASLRGVSLVGKTTSDAWECVRKWVGNMYVYVCQLRPPVPSEK